LSLAERRQAFQSNVSLAKTRLHGAGNVNHSVRPRFHLEELNLRRAGDLRLEELAGMPLQELARVPLEELWGLEELAKMPLEELWELEELAKMPLEELNWFTRRLARDKADAAAIIAKAKTFNHGVIDIAKNRVHDDA